MIDSILIECRVIFLLAFHSNIANLLSIDTDVMLTSSYVFSEIKVQLAPFCFSKIHSQLHRF